MASSIPGWKVPASIWSMPMGAMGHGYAYRAIFLFVDLFNPMCDMVDGSGNGHQLCPFSCWQSAISPHYAGAAGS
jgi:hypothetical protein